MKRLYEIFAGLGGGFGGANYQCSLMCENILEAEVYANQCAVEIYESYEGMHGLHSFEDVIDEITDENPELTQEEIVELAQSEYLEHMESWLSYYAKPLEQYILYATSGNHVTVYSVYSPDKETIEEYVKDYFKKRFNISLDSYTIVEYTSDIENLYNWDYENYINILDY